MRAARIGHCARPGGHYTRAMTTRTPTRLLAAALAALTTLAACGADGPPFVPTGSASVGIGTGGVSTGATLGATNGTFTIGVGI